MASLADILATVQQGVTAANGMVKQMTGSLNNINSQLTSIQSQWTAYTPAVTAVVGTVVATSAGIYHQIGKIVFTQFSIVFSSGAAGSGYIVATLPPVPCDTSFQ